MLKKLKSNKGMTMSLSIVLAVVITAVSLSVTALVASVAMNQVNAAKANYENLTLENKMYDFMNDCYSDDVNKYLDKVIYEYKETPSFLEGANAKEKFKYDSEKKIAYINYSSSTIDEYVVASKFVNYQEIDGKDVYKVDLYIATCSDFKYGEAGVECVKFRVDFGNYSYTVKSAENVKWEFDFYV